MVWKQYFRSPPPRLYRLLTHHSKTTMADYNCPASRQRAPPQREPRPDTHVLRFSGSGMFQVRFCCYNSKLLFRELVHDIFQPADRKNTLFAWESKSHGWAQTAFGLRFETPPPNNERPFKGKEKLHLRNILAPSPASLPFTWGAYLCAAVINIRPETTSASPTDTNSASAVVCSSPQIFLLLV